MLDALLKPKLDLIPIAALEDRAVIVDARVSMIQ